MLSRLERDGKWRLPIVNQSLSGQIKKLKNQLRMFVTIKLDDRRNGQMAQEGDCANPV